MTKGGWHITTLEGSWSLSRLKSQRLDVSAQTWLPRVHPVRLMHQVRQDMWRRLKNVRGFAPMVQLTPDAGGWCVTAGGQVSAIAQSHAVGIEDVLTNKNNRARWIRHAGEWRGEK
ncbi:MAG: hypothetical protein ABJQ34_09985 [Paracoccaceae bacterium]